MSEEAVYCMWISSYCLGEPCPFYHYQTQQCKLVMAVNRYLGDFDTPTEKAPHRKQTPLAPPRLKPFPVLESGKFLQEITGEVVGDVEVREVNTRGGPKAIANFYLTDGKSKIRVGLWEDFVSEAEKLRSGDVITLKGMSIRPPYKGEEQISSTSKTEIL